MRLIGLAAASVSRKKADDGTGAEGNEDGLIRMRAHDFVRDAIGEDVEPRLRELLDGHERPHVAPAEPRERPATSRPR